MLAAPSMGQVKMARKDAQRGVSEGLSCTAESLTDFSYFVFLAHFEQNLSASK